MTKQQIRLGHSPDSDDAFMFYGLASGAVDNGPYEFEHILRDIQTLNDWAKHGRLEVTAVSVHAYAYLQDRYALLSSGASMGAARLADYRDNTGQLFPAPGQDDDAPQGPLLVTRENITLSEVTKTPIAIPGTLTTAFLVLQMALGKFRYEVLSFDEILPAVAAGKFQAGLLIHEGQLTYQDGHLHCLLDLGRWWFEQTRLPLPLGCNIIRRDLGIPAMKEINTILTRSIEYGLTHRDEALDYALQFSRGLNKKKADDFVGMYVNCWTIDYGPLGRRALEELFRCAGRKKLIPPPRPLDFI